MIRAARPGPIPGKLHQLSSVGFIQINQLIHTLEILSEPLLYSN